MEQRHPSNIQETRFSIFLLASYVAALNLHAVVNTVIGSVSSDNGAVSSDYGPERTSDLNDLYLE
jgi:hypothetical protein